MAQSTWRSYLNRRQLLVAVLLVVGLYVLVPQFGNFHASWRLLRRPEPGWLVTAIVLTLSTYLAAALTYYWLAFRRLNYGEVVLVQLAAMFINRLLPAGLGALGTNYKYLRRTHTATQAATVVAINNLLGLAGHILLVGLVFLMVGISSTPAFGIAGRLGGGLGLILGVIVVTLLVERYGGTRYKRWLQDLRSQIVSYRRRPSQVLAALLSSMALTLGNVLSLYCCAAALGVHIGLLATMLIFTFGVGVGAVTPTPGGLGGFEAGLVGGFITYHIAPAAALAVALLYRLVSYWLPLLAGIVGLVLCQRRQLFSE